MNIKANILIGVASAALMAVPATGQTQTTPPPSQDAPSGQTGQAPGVAIIRIVPGAAPEADSGAPEMTEEGVTQEEAAEAEPTLAEPADGASTATGEGTGTGTASTGGATASGTPGADAADSPMAEDGATGDATQGGTGATASGTTGTGTASSPMAEDGATGEATQGGTVAAGSGAQPTDLGRTAESYGQNQNRDAIAFGENERQDGAAGGAGTGATADGSAVESAIERADAPTTGVTDTQSVDEAAQDADRYGFEFDDMDDGASAGMQGGMGGMDMNVFAREVFEQGYRQGYVAALTEMRMRASRDGQMRMREQRRAQEQRQQPRGNRIVVTEDEDGNAIIMLPPGVSPRDFLQQMQRRSN